MKVRNTPGMDLLFSTLPDKLLNFAHGRQRFTSQWEAIMLIKATFPKVSYTGSEPFNDICAWCEQQFGNDWLWNWTTIYFKHERDRTLFLLRWP